MHLPLADIHVSTIECTLITRPFLDETPNFVRLYIIATDDSPLFVTRQHDIMTRLKMEALYMFFYKKPLYKLPGTRQPKN